MHGCLLWQWLINLLLREMHWSKVWTYHIEQMDKFIDDFWYSLANYHHKALSISHYSSSFKMGKANHLTRRARKRTFITNWMMRHFKSCLSFSAKLKNAELIQNGPNSKLHSTVSLMAFLPNMTAMPMQSKFILMLTGGQKNGWVWVKSSIFVVNIDWFFIEESTTDIGLPEDQTRDNGWNTNNAIESAFRVFDLAFLHLLQNKRHFYINFIIQFGKAYNPTYRIDRLGTILLIKYFPYYQQWPLNEPHWSKAYMQQGHDLWEGNWILPAPGDTGKYIVMASRNRTLYRNIY
jgi:hypothetical protein